MIRHPKISTLFPYTTLFRSSPRFSASGYHGPIQLGASHLTLCNSAHPHLRLLCFIDQHWSPLSQSVMTVTAPVPLFRRQHQTADNGIAMHVTQLLHPLLLCEHDEIVKAMLPNMSLGKRNLPQGGLPWIHPGPTPIQQLPCERLFQDLHHHRGIAALRLAEQKMNVLGHQNVSNHHETVPAPHPLHDF